MNLVDQPNVIFAGETARSKPVRNAAMKYAKAYDRDAALNAALTLFWSKGFHATSIKDLETALGMRSGSIYAAFKSKENLYALALERYFTASQTAFERDVLNAPSPLDGLVEMIRRTGRCGDILQRPCMLIKAVITATDDTAETAELARGYRNQMDRNMVEGFRKALELGELPADTDVEDLAHQYQTVVMGLQIEAQMTPDAEQFSKTVERQADQFASLRLTQ